MLGLGANRKTIRAKVHQKRSLPCLRVLTYATQHFANCLYHDMLSFKNFGANEVQIINASMLSSLQSYFKGLLCTYWFRNIYSFICPGKFGISSRLIITCLSKYLQASFVINLNYGE